MRNKLSCYSNYLEGAVYNSFTAAHICEIVYEIFTKTSINQITGFHRCASIWGQFTNLPQAMCPNRSNIIYLHQTQTIRKWDVLQTWILQRVDIYICVHLCCRRERHFEDSLLRPGVKFAAVTKLGLQQLEEKTTNIFAASGFHKIVNIHV